MVSVGNEPSPDFEYVNGIVLSEGNRAYIALRGSQCRTIIDNDEQRRRCPFQARYMMLGDGGVAGLCGHHVPDYWTDEDGATQTVGRGVFQRREIRCDAHTKGSHHTKDETAENAPQAREMEPGETRCNDRATLLIWHDGQQNHAVCKRHARTAWLDEVRLTYSRVYDHHDTANEAETDAEPEEATA